MALLFALSELAALPHSGVVRSGGIPVPGATITAIQGDKKIVTTTDDQGRYSFSNLAEGIWTIEVEMLGFSKQRKEIGVIAEAPRPEWDLKLLGLAEIQSTLRPAAARPAAVARGGAPASVIPNPAPATGGGRSQQQRPGGQGGRGTAGMSGTQAGNNGRPVLNRSGQQNGQAADAGFQRLDVNQSGDLSQAGQAGALSNEAMADLSQNAAESLLVNGSVSRGLEMGMMPDWFGGRGGMEMMGMGPGGRGGMEGMGIGGLNGDPNNGDNPGGINTNQQQLTGGAGGRGGRGGPGGAGAMAGGPGGFGGRGGGPGGGGPGGGGPGGGGRGAGGGRGGRGGAFGGRAGVAAFGNARRNPRMLYNGNFSFNLSNSALDAQTYSVTGAKVDKAAYARANTSVMFGGPLKIPHLISGTRSMFTFNYQVNRSRNGSNNVYTMPSALERIGDFSQSYAQKAVTIFDPLTGKPFPGNVIPGDRISPIATALAKFYPSPNLPGYSRNYAVPITSVNNTQNLNVRLNQTINQKNRINGGIGFQSSDGNNPDVFGFRDTRSGRNFNVNVAYSHNFTTRIIGNISYRFSRSRNNGVPFFAFLQDVEGDLGISGASRDPINWGPPGLSFTNFTRLSDSVASLSRIQTSALTAGLTLVHNLHNLSFGAGYQRQQSNILSDSNPRGSFTFTGNQTSQIVNGVAVSGTGFDFADFMLGLPTTNALSYGNADKYFRGSVFNLFAQDDWRISTRFTLNIGLRWDYQTPVKELYGRLVNLDIAPGFTAIAPVLPGQTGSLSGIHYNDTLLRGDPHNISPRFGFAWRPSSKHSLRINGGYGLYYLTSVYSAFANNMAAQPPFARSFNVSTALDNPLTIAGFTTGPNTITNTRAIDPNYNLGYVQSWQLSVQQDLVRALTLNMTFNHTKGTGLDQQFLPGSLAPGSTEVSLLPSGYIYQQAHGNSTFNSATVNLNRRFRSGLMSGFSYMLSKAIDSGGVGTLIAQNWLDLRAERALSNFDARHTLNINYGYSSGFGRRGGGLLTGWKAVLLKGWNINGSISVRSGTPLTATAGGNRSVVGGTGVSGPVRASATGASLDPPTPGYGFNILAFAAPAAGEWGTAGRNTIPGPMNFSMNGSMSRGFQLAERKNLDLQLQASNILNHVTITNWGTTIGSSTFGLPTSAAGMRRVTAVLRFRF